MYFFWRSSTSADLLCSPVSPYVLLSIRCSSVSMYSFFRSSILLCERDSKSIVTICFMDRPLVGFSRDSAPKRGSQIVITFIPITDRLTCVIDLHLFESSNFAVSASKFSMSLDAEISLKTDIFPHSFTS